MNEPGMYNLGDVAVAAINAATTATVVTTGADASGATVAYIGDLDGMLSATLQITFSYGSSGGTSIKAIVETSMDQGASWCEVWRAAFTTVSEQNVVNLSGLTAVGTAYTPTALADDATKDGILGPRWRMGILTVGTYVGAASLSGRLIAR
jgi:hypothetical protein